MLDKAFKSTRGKIGAMNVSPVIIFALLLLVWIYGETRENITIVPQGKMEMNYPELDELANRSLSFTDLSDYFKNLAEEKGAEYAYKVLKVAPIPPNTDMHLMGHIVGDVLYKQQGAEGIKICTQDFRNACSHSIVIGLFLDKGEGGLQGMAKICHQAPGGSGAYTMCFHGLGHGTLASTGYDMPKAIYLCEKTGTEEYNNREAIECIGGAVMEINGGGSHDPVLWQKQSQKYLSGDNPLSLCQSQFMPNEAKPMCYTYLTPHLLKLAGADLKKPGEADYKKAFVFCNQIPKAESGNRNACYGGFGKEFVVLAQDRDIRKINEMTATQLGNIYGWCLLADAEDGKRACLSSALNSLYWGGENDSRTAINFCKAIDIPSYGDECFRELIGAVSFYVADANYRRSFCEELPTTYHNECRSRLNI